MNKAELLKFIEENNGISRLDAFKQYANERGLSYKSVRNEYYKAVRNLSSNDYLDLGLKKECHRINKSKRFSNDELNNTIQKIVKLYNRNGNLRASCLKVANFDVKLALRYQNKIRNMNIVEEITKRTSKVLKMPKVPNQKLSDEDITHLFMGLVRLVKRNSEEFATQQVRKNFYNTNMELQETKKYLLHEQREKDLLKIENQHLKRQINEYECQIKKEFDSYEKKLEALFQVYQKYNSK